MSEKKVGASSNSPAEDLDKTFIDEASEGASARAAAAADLDATFVPDSTSVPVRPSQEKRASSPAQKESSTGDGQPKKTGSSQLGKLSRATAPQAAAKARLR